MLKTTENAILDFMLEQTGDKFSMPYKTRQKSREPCLETGH